MKPTTKLSKSQFKSLMKECLLELINEGLFDKKLEQIAEAKAQKNKEVLFGNGKGTSKPTSTTSGQTEQTPEGINPRLIEMVKSVTAAQPSSRKSMFEEIMLDTALTTLQDQISRGGDGFGAAAGLLNNGPVPEAVQQHDEAQLQAMAGGNIGRWALAAFGNNKKRG